MHILCLTDSTLTIYQASKKRLELLLELALCHNNFRQVITHFLDENSVRSLTLLLDLSSEEFREESLPHITGRDRKRLLERKFHNLFASQTFTRSQLINRSKSGRRDDNYLFAGISNTELIEPALALLFEQRIAVSAIYSLPTLIPKLIRSIPHGKQLLLVSLDSYDHEGLATIRQTWLDKGKLSLSRSVKSNSLDPKAIADLIKRETERMLRFLSNMKKTTPGEKVEILFIIPPSILKHTEPMEAPEQSQWLSADPVELLKRSGFQTAVNTVSLLEISCAALAKDPALKSHYKNRRVSLFHQLKNIRKGLFISGLCIAIGCAGLSFLNFQIYQQTSQQITMIGQSIATNKERLSSISKSYKNEKISPVLMKRFVQLHQSLQPVYSSEQIMAAISRAFEQTSELKLTSLAWSRDGSLDMTEGGNQAIDSTTSSSSLEQTEVKIMGDISNFDGNYRRSVNQLFKFVTALEKQPEIESASIEKMPINIDPSKNLSSTAKESGARLFSIRVRFMTGNRHE